TSKKNMVHKVQQLSGSVVQLRRKHHQHISKICATTKCPPELKTNDMKMIINKLICQNKKEYNIGFMKLTTRVSQINQISFNTAAESINTIFNFLTGDDTQSWTSTTTMRRWHHELSESYVRNIFQQANQSNYFTFGIMTNESGRGEKKILVECFMFWNSEKNMPNTVLLETKDLIRCNSDTISQAL
ncbi:13129_t:CDS:1, partial [Ambispora leptoticha]